MREPKLDDGGRMPLLFVPALWMALEIWLLIVVGESIGILSLLLLLGAGLMVGLILARAASAGTLAAAALAIERGEDPSGPALSGLAIMAAGALLAAPGFLSDVVALILLIAPARRALYRMFAPRLRNNVHMFRYTHEARRAGPEDPPIEAEYREIDPPPTDERR